MNGYYQHDNGVVIPFELSSDIDPTKVTFCCALHKPDGSVLKRDLLAVDSVHAPHSFTCTTQKYDLNCLGTYTLVVEATVVATGQVITMDPMRFNVWSRIRKSSRS